MRKWVLPLVIAGLVIASCADTEQPARTVTVIYSGNIGGLIEPCGCNPPLGGLARRATVVPALREQFANTVVLDSGGMLYGGNSLTPPRDFIKRLYAHAALATVEYIGVDAINVGGFDLANSADSLIAFDHAMDTSWLSANLVRRDSGELLFAPDRVIVRGDVRVGVFGLLSGNFMGSPLFRENSSLKVLDAVETAAKEVTKLKTDTDVIVLLAYMSEKEARTIAEKVPGITMIIHSHNNVHTPSSDHAMYAPFMVGDTIFARCPEGGRVVGAMELILAGKDRSFVESTIDSDFNRGRNEAEIQSLLREQGSSYRNTFVDLGPEIRSDETVQAIVDTTMAITTAYDDSLYLSGN